jgi:hypothetical protein
MPKLPKPKPYTSPNWIVRARLEFCNDTRFSSPEMVVEHGIKTVADWCDTLNKHRDTAQVWTKGTNDGNQPVR